MLRRRILIALSIVPAAASCTVLGGPVEAHVEFKSDAPFCGGTPISYTFMIDTKPVGTERLVHAQTSSRYTTTVGAHVIGARFDGVSTVTPDTTVTLREGQTLTRVLSFYCS